MDVTERILGSSVSRSVPLILNLNYKQTSAAKIHTGSIAAGSGYCVSCFGDSSREKYSPL